MNCFRDIPETASVCEFCEATVGPPPSEEEMEAAKELLAGLSPEAMSELMESFRGSETCDEFVNSIMVGPCPKCGSKETANCEDDPEIGELLLGRCYACGQFWCTECGTFMVGDQRSCECWLEEEDEVED
jgi:hypothetical protein